ncbi:MAG: TIGR03086 family protein [Jatrophihabitans sp.]|nr:MAG: TIGR03086 family protein [Jatrophihabitans sp.]
MDELLDMFLAGSREFGARVHAVAPDRWSAPTPDTEWTVADLVGHLVEEHRWCPPLLHGLDLESARKVVAGTRNLPVGGGTGANLAEAWDEAALGSSAAVTERGALDRVVDLSRGPTSARQYLGEMTFDLTVHSWDLARAIGYDRPLPEDLVGFVYGQVRQLGDLASTGLFAAAVEVPAGASTIDKLVALTGRAPG